MTSPCLQIESKAKVRIAGQHASEAWTNQSVVLFCFVGQTLGRTKGRSNAIRDLVTGAKKTSYHTGFGV